MTTTATPTPPKAVTATPTTTTAAAAAAAAAAAKVKARMTRSTRSTTLASPLRSPAGLLWGAGMSAALLPAACRCKGSIARY
jgi:hypothetical protein